jgi:hypothetical protein
MISEHDKAHIEDIMNGYGTWFSADLLRLIAKADLKNRDKLYQVYPEHVEAYLSWVDPR